VVATNTDLLNALFPLMLMLVGGAASATKLVKGDTFDKLPELLFSVCYPCVILSTVAKTNFVKMLTENSYIAAFTAVLLLIFFAIGLAAARRMPDAKKPVAMFAMMFSNATYIGLPVAQLAFGARGVYFMIVHGVVQDLFLWTIGYRLFSRRKYPSKITAYVNPVIVSVALALGLSLAGAPAIPAIDDVVSAFGSMTVPLALLYTGHILVNDRAGILRIRGGVFGLSAVKVLLIPALTALMALTLPIDNALKAMSIISAGLPVPMMTVMLSKRFGRDNDFAVELLLCSTILYALVFVCLSSFGYFAMYR